jgi:molybdopterin synthase sulfur carrier subunit
MKIVVRFFASLQEATACPDLELLLPPSADFDALCAALRESLGPAALAALRSHNVRVARNHALESPPFVLVDGDEIAFLPPVTGG